MQMGLLRRFARRSRLVWLALVGVGVFAIVWKSLALAGWERKQTRSGFQFRHTDWCDTLVNHGFWTNTAASSCGTLTRAAATCGGDTTYQWQWDPPALKCGAQRVAKAQLRSMFRNKWLVVAGDSIGRFFFAALLRLLSDTDEQKIVYGHQDFEYMLPGKIKASFLWAPYAENLTSHLYGWRNVTSPPHFVVLSSGLWHMLHITDADDFVHRTENLKKAALALTESQPPAWRAPLLAMFSITEVYPPRLKTDEKRQHLTLALVDAYNEIIGDSGILAPAGPVFLIDVHRLTKGCGPTCTLDGLHYSNTTYDAAVQILANNLRLSHHVL